MAISGIRDLRAEDSAPVIELIGSVYDEYPGCVLDLKGADKELIELEWSLRAKGGQGWVVLDARAVVVALVGWTPSGPGTAELKRLYVHKSARGRGLGGALVRHVAGVTSAWGVRWLELWSDTRFEDAHKLYERYGFVRLPASRDLGDLSKTTEYHYVRDLSV